MFKISNKIAVICIFTLLTALVSVPDTSSRIQLTNTAYYNVYKHLELIEYNRKYPNTNETPQCLQEPNPRERKKTLTNSAPSRKVLLIEKNKHNKNVRECDLI